MNDQEREVLIDKISARIKDKPVHYDFLNVDWDCLDDMILQAIYDRKIMWATWEQITDGKHGEGEGELMLGTRIHNMTPASLSPGIWFDVLAQWPDVEAGWAEEFIEQVIELEPISGDSGICCWQRNPLSDRIDDQQRRTDELKTRWLNARNELESLKHRRTLDAHRDEIERQKRNINATPSSMVCGHKGCTLKPGHSPGHTDR